MTTYFSFTNVPGDPQKEVRPHILIGLHADKDMSLIGNIPYYTDQDACLSFPEFVGSHNREFDEFLKLADKVNMNVLFNVSLTGWSADEFENMIALFSYIPARNKAGEVYHKFSRGVRSLTKVGDSWQLISDSDSPILTYQWQYGKAENETVEFPHTGSGSKRQSLIDHLIQLQDAKLLGQAWALEPDAKFTLIESGQDGTLSTHRAINSALRAPMNVIVKDRLDKGEN